MKLSYGGYGFGVTGGHLVGDHVVLSLTRDPIVVARSPFPLWRGRWAEVVPQDPRLPAGVVCVSIPATQWWPDEPRIETAAWMAGVLVDREDCPPYWEFSVRH